MKQLHVPVASFRDVVRELGMGPAEYQVGGTNFRIANAFGETDLIACPHGCSMQGGFYTLTEPREQSQGYVLLLYQCSYCDHLFVKTYDLKELKQYPAQEVKLVVKLVLDVIIKGTHGKRIKLDFFNKT